MLVASGVNIALDLLFVMVFRWDVAGAAAATVIAQLTRGRYLPQSPPCCAWNSCGFRRERFCFIRATRGF